MTLTESLYDFQRDAVEFAASRPGCGLFCEQGTGKTWITAGIIERLIDGRFAGLCVVPLANAETTWARLMARIENLNVCRSWGEFRAADPKSNRLLLLHYEALRGKSLIRKIVRQPWSLVVYDESQRIKARGSKASKLASRFASVDHRVILSGTPVEQSPQDLWAQLRFACPWVLGVRWGDFDARWLKPCGFMGYDREFLWEKLPEFLDLVRPHTMRVTKSEVLDLPPLSYRRERVPLLGDQRRVYQELDREMTTILVDGREIVCDMEITKLVRLQQVVGGFVRTEDGESVAVGSAKARRLRVLLGRLAPPIVVFCKYREEIAIIVRTARSTLAGIRVGVVSGKPYAEGRTPVERGGRKNRTLVVDEFQAGRVDVLACQIRAGGVGLDLFAACDGIVYSAPFSYIEFEQGVSRLHRRGQTRAVTFYLLEIENTVDSTISSALLMKRNVSEQVLEDTTRKKTMAKEQKKEAAKTEAKPEKAKQAPPPQPPKPKYGVPELAEALGVKTSSVRVKLRALKIEKSGKLYGWETKSEMQEVINKIKAAGTRKASAKKGADEDEDEAEAEDEE